MILILTKEDKGDAETDYLAAPFPTGAPQPNIGAGNCGPFPGRCP